MAWMPPWMVTMVCQMVPPLNVWGDSVSRNHISDSLSFQVSRAFSKFSTIQLLSNEVHLQTKHREICRWANLPVIVLDCTNGCENFLGERDQQTAEQAEKALGALAGVVALDAHAHLDDTPAQNDDAQGLDDGKDEVRQVIHDSQRVIASGKGGRCTAETSGNSGRA